MVKLLKQILARQKKKIRLDQKDAKALREVQAVNVHNIPHYIDVISECTRSDAVSNLCDRFR